MKKLLLLCALCATVGSAWGASRSNIRRLDDVRTQGQLEEYQQTPRYAFEQRLRGIGSAIEIPTVNAASRGYITENEYKLLLGQRDALKRLWNQADKEERDVFEDKYTALLSMLKKYLGYPVK